MLMNENSELRSFVSCSKNFLKNKINKSIKNNIVLINNDGGVKSKSKHRGFIPSTFASTVTCIKFSIFISSPIVIYIFIYTLFCSLFLILNYSSSIIFSLTTTYILFSILFIIIIYILFFIVTCILLISLYFISFINLIISSIFIFNTIKNASLIKTSVIIIYQSF